MRTVLVVGGANMDIKARTNAAHVPETSNPGTILTSPGGVGRNIAENLARLGTSVRLVAAVGRDAFGKQLRRATSGAGVDVTGVIRSQHPTGTYLAVLDEDGSLVTGVSSMAATEALVPSEVLGSVAPDVGLLVVDANLPPGVIGALLDRAAERALPVVIDPVSIAKAARLCPVLRGGRPVFALTPNEDELRAMCGGASVDEACERLHALGVTLVWVRAGRDGSLLSSHVAGTRTATRIPSFHADEVEDVTGAGDAMTAGFVHGLHTFRDPALAARFGAATAALAVSSTETVNPDLSEARVLEIMRNVP